MVQLTLLTDVGRSELKALLDTLDAEARAMGASREATQRAAGAALRRFGEAFAQSVPSKRDLRRVADYYRATLSRSVYRRMAREDRRYREYARASAAAADLENVGLSGDVLRSELLETLGFDERTVDAVLHRRSGVA